MNNVFIVSRMFQGAEGASMSLPVRAFTTQEAADDAAQIMTAELRRIAGLAVEGSERFTVGRILTELGINGFRHTVHSVPVLEGSRIAWSEPSIILPGR